MRDVPALIATVDQVAGVATVTVRGEFGSSGYSRLRDRLVWVAENCPQKLVLDLQVSDRFTEQLITLIAAARRQLPAECQLEIRSASPAVRDLVELAGWPGVRVTAAGQEAEPARLSGQGTGLMDAAPAEPHHRRPTRGIAGAGLDGTAQLLSDEEMAGITELVLAGHQRILLIQQALNDAGRRGGDWDSAGALATVWDRLADLIEVQAAAEEEICYLPVAEASSWSREQMQDAVADWDEICEAVAEARLQPVGSWPWWRAVKAALSVCNEHFDRQEGGVLADFGSRADRPLRQQLGAQWSAFMAARIGDLTRGQAGDAACQLCQWPLTASHRHVLDTDGCAVLCACPCCYELCRWAARDEPSGA